MGLIGRDTDLIWAAGFIDGDGCITIQNSKNGRYGQPTISASQANIEPLVILRELFGGSIRKHDDNRKPTYSPSYRWRLTATKAVEACRTLLPYLRVRRRQAELVILWQDTALAQDEKRHGLNQKVMEVRTLIDKEIGTLNKKGVLRGSIKSLEEV